MASPHSNHLTTAQIIRQALAVLGLERGDIAALTAYSAFVGVLSLALPLAAQALFANVAFGTLLQPVLILSFIVVALLSFSAVLQLIENVVVERMQRRYFARLAMSFAHALTAGHGSLSDRSAGIDRANRFFEVVNVQKTVSTLLLEGLAVLLQMLVGLSLLAVYHPLLLAFAICLILTLGLITVLWGRRAIETAVDESKAKLAVGNWLHEVAGCPLTFQSASGRQLASRLTDDLATAYVDKRRTHFHVLFRQITGAMLLQVIANASVLAIGGWLVIVGQLTLGQLVAAELVVSAVAAGIGKLGKFLEAFYDLAASTDKVCHVLAMETTGPEDGERLPAERPDQLIRMHGVEDSATGLSEADWSIAAGKIVGIHHPAPLTLRPFAELLTATRRPAKGHLELLGIDYREIDRAAVLESITLVNRCEVFPGSVYDNVALGAEDVERSRTREALATVELLEPMMDLPDGLQTRLEEYGHFLAPGQRWRLMLARALAHGCPLIVIETIPPEMTTSSFIALLSRLRVELLAKQSALLIFTDNEEVLLHCDESHELVQGRIEPWEARQ